MYGVNKFNDVRRNKSNDGILTKYCVQMITSGSIYR